MMRLGTVIPYLKKIEKIYESRDTCHESCWDQQFSPEISKFYYIKKYTYRLHFDIKFLIILAFLEPLRIFLVKKVTSLMMPAKMVTPGLLKITVFWNKGYDVIIYVNDVTIKSLSRDSNYMVHVIMWPKFGNSNISMSEVIIISIL